MSTQPEALRLADALEISSNHGIRREAAAELRRLHAENQRCRNVCDATSDAWWADAEEWKAQRDQLLEALKKVEAIEDKMVGSDWEEIEEAREIARAALAEPVQEPQEWLTGCPECGMDGGCDCPSGTWNPPQRKPLTEEEIEQAYREIWRELPSDFDHTSSGWIEMGIRYAERAHGIT